MKVTKFVHSCILVEQDGKRALVDPGVYSWESGQITPEVLQEIDYVVVTHPHPDHVHIAFAESIQAQSPNAVWYVTPATQKILQSIEGLNIETVSTLSDVVYVKSEHASLELWGECEDHTSYKLFDSLLISGDSHSIDAMHGCTVFAAAINGGPWGSVTTFLRMVDAMHPKPKVVLPLHDWHWNDQARANFYVGIERALSDMGVQFVPLANGTGVEVKATPVVS